MSRKQQSVYSVLSQICYIAKPFGMAPYSIENGTLKTKRGPFHVTIAIVVAAVMIYCYANTLMPKRNSSEDAALRHTLIAIASIRIASAVTAPFFFLWKSTDFKQAYDRIHKVDVQNPPYPRPAYKRLRTLSLLILVAVLLATVSVESARFCFLGETYQAVLFDALSNGLQFVVHSLVLLHFQIYVAMLLSDFGALKSHIRKTVRNPSSAGRMRQIGSIYSELCKGAESINAAFSLPLFFMISMDFTEAILGTYIVYSHEGYGDETRDVARAVLCAVELLVILVPPRMVGEQLKAIAQCLSEITEPVHTNEEFIVTKKLLLMRTLHQNISFAACGFFSISTSIVLEQFGVSLSFLLLMFQLTK